MASGPTRRSASISKRNSIIEAPRPPLHNATAANTSALRASGSAKPSQATLTRRVSASGPTTTGRSVQQTVSAADVQLQRQRAKEIYSRDIKGVEELEKERREREAAAK